MARIVPTILLHFLHPTHMAKIVPTILLHFLHPWRSDVGSAENAICPWMNGQTFAPAISALPPSVVVVLGQRICTGRTVLGQCRSYCRGAVVEERLPRSNFLPWRSDIFMCPYKSTIYTLTIKLSELLQSATS